MTVHETIAQWSQWGWPLLGNHLWQSTLFAALAALACLALRRAPARLRYGIWLIVLVKFMLPAQVFTPLVKPLMMRLQRQSAPARAWRQVILSQGGAQIIETVSAPLSATTPSKPINPTAPALRQSRGHNEIYCLITLLWLCGVAAIIALWISRVRAFAAAAKSITPAATEREAAALQAMIERLALGRKIDLVVSTEVREPGVWRVWRPAIMMPASIADQLSDGELQSLMLHELIHIKRWDNLVGNLQMACNVLLWFCPPLWLVERKLLAERELACDEQVLALGSSASDYAAGLLKAVRFSLGWKMATASYAANTNMQRRIQMIIADNKNRRAKAWHRLLIGAAAAAALCFSLIPAIGRGVSASTSDYPTGEAYAELSALLHEGNNLRVEQAKELEKALEKDPNNVDARVKLVGFYSGSNGIRFRLAEELKNRKFESKEAATAFIHGVLLDKKFEDEKYSVHMRWFAEHRPDSPLMAVMISAIETNFNKPHAFLEPYSRSWHTRNKPVTNPQQARHGKPFQFMLLHDLSEELLQSMQASQPDNVRIAKALGNIYAIRAHFRSGDEKRRLSAKALEQFERVLADQGSDSDRVKLLLKAMTVTYDAGNTEKAKEFATNLIASAIASKSEIDSDTYGEALHHGNIILGRVALQAGDIDTAKIYLQEAGKTPGSAALATAGPNMKLAAELLDRGEPAAVIEYLRQCERFWESGRMTINNWIAIIEDKGKLEFALR